MFAKKKTPANEHVVEGGETSQIQRTMHDIFGSSLATTKLDCEFKDAESNLMAFDTELHSFEIENVT